MPMLAEKALFWTSAAATAALAAHSPRAAITSPPSTSTRAPSRARGESAGSFHVRDILSTDGLNLSAAPFSIVVCQLVISLVGGVAERARLLQNAHDSLEPGGWLYLSASGISDDINPGYARLYDEDFAETGEHGTYFSRGSAGNILYATHHFTEPELRALLDASGFQVSKITVKKEASSRRPEEAARFLYAVARMRSLSDPVRIPHG